VNQNQQKASITQLFYDNNYYHDYWYDSGFDEASGNAQASNFGRGGVEGDVLLAEAQDFSGTDNANMATPADGDSPRMQMFKFTGPGGGVQRDGAIDNGIVGHEWGHYIHGRLTAGENAQYGAMGEGWGDFQALMQVMHGNDNFAGTFATGIYASAAFQDSAYYGIRRYPYSTSFNKNGLTFKHIGDSQTLPPGYSPVFAGNGNSEVHNAGEVWCTMMWEGYSNLLEDTLGGGARHTFDQAKRKMADYVVGGMKLAPYDPTFTEQRDGILAAAVAGGDALDFQDLAAGFATRGAGPCAVSPARTSTTLNGVVEDFTATTANAKFASFALVEGTPSCDSDGIVDVGEGGVVKIGVQNTGWGALNGATVTVTSTNPNVQFPNGNSASVPSTNAYSTSSVNINVTLGAAITTPTLVPFTIVINAPGSCATTVNATGSAEVAL
jgi:extracellular elastinolytic metalloproteinase